MFFYASLFKHHENAWAEWFRISEGSEVWYRVYTLEMNSLTVRVITKQMCRLHAQVHNVCHLGVHILPSAALHAEYSNGILVRKDRACVMVSQH